MTASIVQAAFSAAQQPRPVAEEPSFAALAIRTQIAAQAAAAKIDRAKFATKLEQGIPLKKDETAYAVALSLDLQRQEIEVAIERNKHWQQILNRVTELHAA